MLGGNLAMFRLVCGLNRGLQLVVDRPELLQELDSYGGDLGSSQPGMGGREPGAGSAQPDPQ